MSEFPNPESTRREGVPFVSIRLADGRPWGFARPTPRFVPIIIDDEERPGRSTTRVVVRIAFGYSLEISRLVEAMRIASEGHSASQQYEAFCALSIALLRRVHDIPWTTAHALLSISDDELPRLVQNVLEVVSEEPSGLEFENEMENGLD
jgi:hypothetical protein